MWLACRSFYAYGDRKYEDGSINGESRGRLFKPVSLDRNVPNQN
jgi:hypothetical protein